MVCLYIIEMVIFNNTKCDILIYEGWYFHRKNEALVGHLHHIKNENGK